jgi:hypothetical protein
VALLKKDVSEEPSASSIRATRTGELGTTLAVTRTGFLYIQKTIVHSHRREILKSYVAALTVWTLYQRRNVSSLKYELGFHISQDGILHSHCRENLKCYIALTRWAV